MINNTNQLNEQQLQDLKVLAQVCKKKDGSTPNLYPHILAQHRAFPASLLYYDKDQLIAFLSIYFFYDDAVEVSVLVHPEYRQQGIAKQLIQTILPLVQYQNYFTLIFSAPKGLNSFLVNAPYLYLHSEYYMERNELTPILEYNKALTFRAANFDDIPTLSILDELCFPQKHGHLPERFNQLLDNREYEVILAIHNNIIIGKAHIRWTEQEGTFSDIAIHPQQQAKGFGTSLIAYCINHALSKGIHSLNLDVETHNKTALNLYTRLGFAVHNACDFWSIDIAQLTSHILSPKN